MPVDSAASSRLSLGIKILFLALLYYASGRLGLLLAVPPGYATIIWPPSGIAMAFLFLYGTRLWPGVFLGAFFVCMDVAQTLPPLHGIVTAFQENIANIGTALMIASGSTLQVLAGRYVIKRACGNPISFQSVWDVLRCFLLYIPVVCLISAGIGMTSLYAMGQIGGNVLLRNALTWWGGDCLGVMIFLPFILLSPWARTKMFWKKKEFTSLSYASLIIWLIPLSMTFYAWKVSSDYIYEKNKMNFEVLTEESEKALRNRIQSYELVLIGAKGFFHATDTVTQSEWETYINTLRIPENLPGIRTIGYIESVPEDRIEDFVQKRQADGAPDFQVKHFLKGGDHFIIKYVHSEQAAALPLGVNIAFEDHRYQAAVKSRDTGNPAITKRITLLTDGQKGGFLLMEPLYKKNMPIETLEQRRAALQGWIYATFVGQQIMKDITRSQNETVHLQVYDGGEAGADNIIYDSAKDGNIADNSSYIIKKTLPFMQEEWTLIWSGTDKFEKITHNLAPTIIVIGGLAFTMLFGVFLIFINFRTQIVENIVQAKTREISFSENRLKLLVRNTPAAVAMFDQKLNYIMASDRWIRDYNLDGRDIIGKSHYDIFPEIAKDPAWRESFEKSLQGQTLGSEEHAWVRNDGRMEWMKWALHPWSDSDGHIGGVVMFTEDITERKQHEIRGNLLKEIIVDVTNLSGIESILASIIHNICADMKWDVGHVLMWDRTSSVYESSHIWYFKDERGVQSDFRKKTADRIYKMGEGIPGKCAQQQRILYIGKLAGAEDYADHETLDDVGIKSALYIPVLVKGSAIAVIELYSSYETPEDKMPLAFYDMAGLQIGRLIEKKMAEQALQESQRLNEAILSSAEYMIIATDRQGDIVLFNKQAEKMLGYSRKEVLNRPFSKDWLTRSEYQRRYEEALEEFNGDVRPDFDLFSKKAIRHGVYEEEWTFIRKNNLRFPVKLSVTPIRDMDGDIVGFLAIGEDITGWKIQQDQLKQSEETFRSALQSASIGMGLVDISGKWLVVNKAICDLLGYSEQELLETDFQSITHPDDLGIDLEHVAKILSGELDSYQLEKRYYHKDGHVIWTLLSVGLVRQSDGAPKYFISQIQDITERREVDRIKSEFISIVSHELRTPLTSIRGSLSLLEGTMAGDLPEKALKLVSMAHKNSERLISLINDILDLEKISAGKMAFDMKEENIILLVNQAAESMQSYAQRLNVKICLHAMPEKADVLLDGSRFQQVLANILSNALKFSPPGENVDVRVREEGDDVIISVIDKGVGIAGEYHEKIFDKFFQVDSSITRSKGGTGLGLHISREIVERMNGKIGLISKPGMGTEFWVRFPIIKDA